MADDNIYEIGSRLKKIRKEKKLTQDKISEMLGISQKHYSEVERDIAGLSVKHWIQISEILDVSLDYLLKGVAESDNYNEKNIKEIDMDIKSIIESSTEYTRQRILMILQIIKDIELH